MNRAYYFFLLLLSPVLFTACSGAKGVTHDPSDVLLKIQKSYAATENLSIKGTMKVSGVPATIWFETLVKGYDSLKLVMTGPFGMNIGALSSTPTHFTFLELFQENVVYEGTPNRETFAKSMQLGLGYRDIVALMRCEVPHIPTRSEIQSGKLTVENQGKSIKYVIVQGSVTTSFTVDPEKLVITDYELKRRYGSEEVVELSVTYEGFYKEAGNRTFPEKATAVLNDGAQTLRISVDKVKDEIENGINLAIDIPKGMERRTL